MPPERSNCLTERFHLANERPHTTHTRDMFIPDLSCVARSRHVAGPPIYTFFKALAKNAVVLYSSPLRDAGIGWLGSIHGSRWVVVLSKPQSNFTMVKPSGLWRDQGTSRFIRIKRSGVRCGEGSRRAGSCRGKRVLIDSMYNEINLLKQPYSLYS